MSIPGEQHKVTEFRFRDRDTTYAFRFNGGTLLSGAIVHPIGGVEVYEYIPRKDIALKYYNECLENAAIATVEAHI